MIRCAHCGLAITPEKHKGHVYYHCTQYNGKHDAKWLREEEITRQIGEVFKRLQLPLEIVEQIIQTLSTLHEDKMKFTTKRLDDLTREQRSVTIMMDNLYMDKLKGRITETAYDKYNQTFRAQLDEINGNLDRLQEADNNYFITAKYILDLTSRAFELFVGSEVEEKRQLIKLVLSNLMLDGEKHRLRRAKAL